LQAKSTELNPLAWQQTKISNQLLPRKNLMTPKSLSKIEVKKM